MKPENRFSRRDAEAQSKGKEKIPNSFPDFLIHFSLLT